MQRELYRWSFGQALAVRAALAALATLAAPAAAWADPVSEGEPAAPGPGPGEEEERVIPRLGLDIGEPNVKSAPPATAFGVAPATSKDSVLDFHGYLLLPLNAGLMRRENPPPGQDETIFHTPPLIPQDYRRFQYTAVVPSPWIQLNLDYGNSRVAGTVILAASAATEAEAFYDPVKQLGVSNAFVTLNLSDKVGIPFAVRGGAMELRYGAMGAFDAGRYATPLIARVNAIGEQITASYTKGRATFAFEEGLGGQLARAPTGFPSAGWNDFADPNVGSSYVAHVHGGVSIAGRFQLGLHHIIAFSRDDQNVAGVLAKGHIEVFGADARLTWGRFGHFYLGAAHTWASNAGVVGGIIEILNSRGGPGLVAEYLGPNSGGNGGISTIGFQYDFSVARAMFGDRFHGRNPDLLLSLFGIGAKVTSDDPTADGVLKLKAGLQATYTLMSWFAVSGRFDHVRPDDDFNRRSFTVYTADLLFHTKWQSRDEFVLQYSHFVYGREVYVESGTPPMDNPSLTPDRDVLSLSVTFWW
jgi:hypothetical protein